MHEHSVVQAMIDHLCVDLARHRARNVHVVRVRRSSAFSETALRQSFALLSAGTLIEGARLEVETVSRIHHCACGREQVVTSDDLVGHMFTCPGCGELCEIDEHHDLELLDVTAEADDEPD
jgi:Zn finger protein HypA/HybF involved in hydrogenase expression